MSKAANVAYECLSDPTFRAAYDSAFLKSVHQPGSAVPGHTNSATQNSARPSKPPPQKLNVSDCGWSFSIRIGEAYKPYQWGPGLVFAEEHKVLVFLKVRKRSEYISRKTPDVRLAVASTPQNCAIRKIESLLRHRMTPAGPEEQLLVTIFTFPHARGALVAQKKGTPSCFNFGWQIQPKELRPYFQAPGGVRTWGTCLIFLTRPPQLVTDTPCQDDNPRYVLLHDKDLQSETGKACQGSHMKCAPSQGCPCTRTTKVAWDKEGEKMYRLAAFGWQTRGMGKGEACEE